MVYYNTGKTNSEKNSQGEKAKEEFIDEAYDKFIKGLIDGLKFRSKNISPQ